MTSDPTIATAETPARPGIQPGGRVQGTLFDTWEMEILLSAGMIFGLMQAPGWLARAKDFVALHFEGSVIFFLIVTYLEFAVYGLIIGFIAHLAVRGFYVGLQGLHSVFPGEVLWDKLKAGPLSLKFAKANWPKLSTLIEKSDQVGSIIFAFAFIIVIACLYFCSVLAVFGIIVFFVELRFPLLNLKYIPVVILSLLFLPFFVVLFGELFSKWKPAFFEKHPFLAKIWMGLLKYIHILSMGYLISPLGATLISYLNKRVYNLVVFTFFGILAIVVVGSTLARRDVLTGSRYPFFETRARQSMWSDHYADQRGPELMPAVIPFIQSDIVKDDYLKLFLPYRPRMNQELLERCPELEGLFSEKPDKEGDRAAKQATRDRKASGYLACLSDYFRVYLDENLVENRDFTFYNEPRQKVRGLMRYLPIADLAPGKHLLRIEQGFPADEDSVKPDEQGKARETKKPKTIEYFIHFWH